MFQRLLSKPIPLWYKIVVIVFMVILLGRLCISAILFYPTLLGISARLRTESVQDWELPPSTELIDFNIREIYGAALTHPESCGYMAVLTLETPLSTDEVAQHYHQYESLGNLWIEEKGQTEMGRKFYDISFSFFSDPAWGYNCDHKFGSIPTTREAGP